MNKPKPSLDAAPEGDADPAESATLAPNAGPGGFLATLPPLAPPPGLQTLATNPPTAPPYPARVATPVTSAAARGAPEQARLIGWEPTPQPRGAQKPASDTATLERWAKERFGPDPGPAPQRALPTLTADQGQPVAPTRHERTLRYFSPEAAAEQTSAQDGPGTADEPLTWADALHPTGPGQGPSVRSDAAAAQPPHRSSPTPAPVRGGIPTPAPVRAATPQVTHSSPTPAPGRANGLQAAPTPTPGATRSSPTPAPQRVAEPAPNRTSPTPAPQRSPEPAIVTGTLEPEPLNGRAAPTGRGRGATNGEAPAAQARVVPPGLQATSPSHATSIGAVGRGAAPTGLQATSLASEGASTVPLPGRAAAGLEAASAARSSGSEGASAVPLPGRGGAALGLETLVPSEVAANAAPPGLERTLVASSAPAQAAVPLPGRSGPLGLEALVASEVASSAAPARAAVPPGLEATSLEAPSAGSTPAVPLPGRGGAATPSGFEATSLTPPGEAPPSRSVAARPVGSGPAGLMAGPSPLADISSAPPQPLRETPTAPHQDSGDAATGSTPGRSGQSFTRLDTVALEPGEGSRLHHYEIIKLIGRGGMGAVYLARDTRLGRKVAIKFLRAQSPDLARRFILEARMTAACSHENIVTIFEVDAWQSSPFMVFEYLVGQPMTKLIPEGKPMPAPRAVELMIPVVRALAYAHSQGVVHRDLKPDNIFVCDTGVTKVLDFGIAKVLQTDEQAPSVVSRPRAPKHSLDDEDDSQEELTQKGAMMGTLSYMAPEQWGIGVPIDHRADIWSVGIMLFRMLAGRHPLDPLRGQQLMVTGILDQPMPLLATKVDGVPKELAAIVDRCLQKRKEARWPDAVTLLRALEPYLPGRFAGQLNADESPYAGLAAFQESDANRFFGRSLEIAATVNRVRERPLLGVVGPSGAGKSSFVRAGLVPALKRSGEPWEALVLRPGRAPLGALAALISPMMSTSASVADELDEQQKLAARLKTEPGFFGGVLRARARREKRNILLFVDQFEELYTLVPDQAERHAFTASLAAAADDPTSPIRLVVSLRSDFLDRVAEDPRFMAELSAGLVFLGSPGVDGLKEAIVSPAELAGYRLESPTIVDDMTRHLASTPGALPLLQFAATKLWDARDPAKKLLTQAAYLAIGGVTGALASHADAVVGKLSGQTAALARAIMLRLVTPERTRAIVSLDELHDLSPQQAELQGVVDELVAARLLTVQTGGGAATVELVHESLITGWPTLRRWLDESGEDAAFLEQVRGATRQWQANDRADDLLWRGALADEAERFLHRSRGPIPEGQAAYLQAVVARKARQASRRRAMVGGAFAVLLMLVAASAVALVIIRQAEGEARQNAVAAKEAAAVAKERQAEAEKKEQERAAAALQAQAKAREAEQARDELAQALRQSEEARERAAEAEKRAGAHAQEAVDARKASDRARADAELAARQLADRLEKERQRAKALEEASGSPVIETLK